MRGVLARLDQWLFGKTGPETLAALRIIFGFLVLMDLSMFGVLYRNFFMDNSLMPQAVTDRYLFTNDQMRYWWPGTPIQVDLGASPLRLNFFHLLPFDWWPPTFYVLTMVAALCFMLGYRTRIASVIAVAGILSFQLRGVMYIHAGDTLIRLTMMYLMFGQCGRVYSLDWLRAKVKPENIQVWAFPQRLIALQTALCYVATVWWKWHGSHWHDGTATWFPPHLTEFQRFPVPEFMLRQPFIMMETWGTLVIELALGTLVFDRRFRRAAVVGGLFLHAYIGYAFNIPMFSSAITSTYLAFYEAPEIKARVNQWKSWWAARRSKAALQSPAQGS